MREQHNRLIGGSRLICSMYNRLVGGSQLIYSIYNHLIEGSQLIYSICNRLRGGSRLIVFWVRGQFLSRATRPPYVGQRLIQTALLRDSYCITMLSCNSLYWTNPNAYPLPHRPALRRVTGSAFTACFRLFFPSVPPPLPPPKSPRGR